ncbi:MAG: M12 family metallo-peptidase [Saprospiraceae bacterium]|nr:M12 family metallo-peptidase [Saprospiraceae bacterium]
MKFKFLITSICLFISMALFAQKQSVGIQDKEPLIKINVDPAVIYEQITTTKSSVVQLPFDKLGFSEFTIKEDQILAPDFASARPDIKTYVIQSTQNESIKGRLLITPESSWATIRTPQGLTSFYPQDGNYFLEVGIHVHPEHGANCTHFAEEGGISEWEKKLQEMDSRVTFSNGGVRRNFTLAVVCTGEFYELNGNSDNAVTNVIAATVNGLNVIYENELSARLNILQPFLYKNSNTDIFIPDEMGGDGRTTQAGRAVDMHFNVNSYDIGHVFHKTVTDDGWSSGGVATLGVVCNSNTSQSGSPLKARGWSGSFNNNNNNWISLAAHEFGHMFSATHTFNGEGESCDDAISGTSAYEIGSGTTIMSYQGICATAQNITGSGVADNYFHVHSLFQMVSYVEQFGDCATEVPLNNTVPEVTANPCGEEIRIPKNTPFMLSGSATDAEEDELTFTWEQYDEDGAGSLTQGFIGNQASNSSIAPLFRSFSPSPDTTRYFPQLSTLLEGAASDKFDVLPNRARTLHFQFTARDNNEDGGSVASDEVEVIVEDNGPLTVQNLTAIEAGSPVDLTWALNGTEDMCDLADILLSVDGGITYSIVLAEGVDYSAGSFTFTLPSAFPSTSGGRIMLACADSECYSFFDITNGDCTITSTCEAGSSIICDIEYEEFDQGDPALNFDLTHIDGFQTNAINRVVNDFASTIAPIVIYSETGDCFEFFDYYTNTATVAVDQTGSYTFSVDVGANGGTGIITIYEAATYSQTNPCASFVGASATFIGGGSFSLQSTLTVTLDECKEYLIVFTNNKSAAELPKTTEISNIVGPGTIVEVDESPSTDYSNTFIAVNDAGKIEIVSPSSDFSLLSGGLYDIYTVTYKSGGATPPALVDPSTWPGSDLSDVQTTDCLRLSSNKKQILVDFSCRINSIEAGTQTACDPASNTFSQEVIITYDQPPLSGNLTVNGVAFPITGSPQTVTLVGQIADGMTEGVSAAFSEIPGCAFFVADLFTAPENCCPIELDLGGDRIVCDSEQVILDAGPDGAEYKWFKNGEELMETMSTLEITDSGNYLVEVRTATGCTKFDVVNITINPTPDVVLDEDISVCEGEIYSIQSNTNASTLVWFKDGVEIADETDPSLLVTEAGTYVLMGSNTFDCTAMDTIVIEYVTRPVVDLGEDQAFCEGDPLYVLDAGMDGSSYTWARNSTVIGGENGTTLEVTESGQYTVVVDKGGGCDAMDTVNIEFVPLGQVFAGNDINVCQGSSSELLSFIEADSYEWYLNGVLFSDQSESPEVTEEGEYVLVGLNSIGCESYDTVIVTEVIPPVIDLGEDRVGCIGSDVTLEVEDVGTILWLKDGSFFSSDAMVTITDPGQYIVNVIAASDCTGRDSIMVSFEPGPMLELGDDDGFCSGDSYTINADTDGDNITWFFNGEEIIGENGFDLIVTEGGEYQAIVTGTGNCEVEDVVTITANEVPDLVLGEDEVICDGESVTLETNFGANTYDWQFNGMSISDQPSVSVSDAGIYTLTVVNEFGCSDSDDIEVVANARPMLELDENYTICEGEMATIVANSDGTSFQWFVDGEELMGETGNTIMLSADAMVEVIASSEAGCTSMTTSTVISVAAPTLNLGDDFSLCPNESLVLNAGNHTTYLWSNGQETSTINVISINPEVATQESYSVTVTNEFGCSAEDEVLVDIFPIIKGEIMASASGVCNGEPVELTASGGITYEWDDPNGTLSEIDGPSALASPTESTTYQVIIRDDCPDNEAIVEITIEVFEAGMDVDAGEDDCVVIGGELELNATGGVSYQWFEDATIVSGADTANPKVNPTEETLYFVDITDENGCVFTDSVNVCILDDPLANFKLVSIITPNGDGENDELIFQGLEAFPDNVLTIYNRWGYPVFERSRYQSDSELWNGENGGDVLPADTYYYVLTFDGNTYKNSITIMR